MSPKSGYWFSEKLMPGPKSLIMTRKCRTLGHVLRLTSSGVRTDYLRTNKFSKVAKNSKAGGDATVQSLTIADTRGTAVSRFQGSFSHEH